MYSQPAVNEYGAKVRNSSSQDKLDRFHEWQHNNFNPMNEAALNELNQVILQLQAEDPDGYFGRGGQLTDQILELEKGDRLDTTWDSAIDLRDVPPFINY